MSMSTCVYGIKPPNKKWKEMKKVYDACIEADIETPDEVNEFFNLFDGEEPDDKGVIFTLDKYECCTEYRDDSCEGFEIEIDKLPKNIKIIRFVNSW